MLGLGEGWRLLIGPNHEDVWFDAPLLDDKVQSGTAARGPPARLMITADDGMP